MNLDYILYHLTFLSIALLLTQSLNWIWRSGLFSLGHHAFFCFGTYVGVVVIKLSNPINAPVSFQNKLLGFSILLASIVSAGVLTGIFGYLVAKIFNKLQEDYFAVATLVLGEIVIGLFANWSFVGGSIGYEIPYLVFSNSDGERFLFFCLFLGICISLNVFVFVFFHRVSNSAFGLYITATKEDKLAAELIGIHTDGFQWMVFSIGSSIAGVTGVLFINLTSYVQINDFSFINSIPIILYVVMGRLNIGGCVVSAGCLYSLYEIMKLPIFSIFGDNFTQMIINEKEIIYALILILAVTLPSIYKNRRS